MDALRKDALCMAMMSRTGVDFFWGCPMPEFARWGKVIDDVGKEIERSRNGK